MNTSQPNIKLIQNLKEFQGDNLMSHDHYMFFFQSILTANVAIFYPVLYTLFYKGFIAEVFKGVLVRGYLDKIVRN